jgi:hypothetical protein
MTKKAFSVQKNIKTNVVVDFTKPDLLSQSQADLVTQVAIGNPAQTFSLVADTGRLRGTHLWFSVATLGEGLLWRR